MKIELRLEQPEDYREVEELTRAAFWDMDLPGRERCDEHLLAHKLRSIPAFVPELDYVAVEGGKIAGNIMYSKSKIVDEVGKEYETLTFGPLSVLPSLQGQGIGAMLVKKTLEEAAGMGYRAVLIFGHPDYYKRFGFQNAEKFQITTAEGDNFDAFMALELYPGALNGISGKFFYDSVFEIDPREAEVFDRHF